MADYASEGGHFYERSGEPAYTIVAKNGIERQTTLRDARKLDLVPGVSTILQCAARPGLEVWKRDQVLLAALTLPRMDGESEASWLARVIKDSAEQGRRAAERGTEIHGALEQSARATGIRFDHPLFEWVREVFNVLQENCGEQTWKPEKSYAHRYGYGCKVDLHSDQWLIDYKGKDDSAKDDLVLYLEHFMQLAANRLAAGIPQARCAIVFFGRQTPWAKFIEASADDLQQGWDCFEALLSFYQAKNRIDR